VNLKTAIQFAPELLRRPRWLLGYAKTGKVPDLTVPNMTGRGEAPPTFFDAYGQWAASAPPTWDDVQWLGEQWGGPFMVKGVTRVDDAKRAADAGVTAISVSSHGGNDLDGTPATIRVLPGIVAAVGDQLEIVLDDGIRRGGDVVKAVALGARVRRKHRWKRVTDAGSVLCHHHLSLFHPGVWSPRRENGRGAGRGGLGFAAARWPGWVIWLRSGSGWCRLGAGCP
jgi:FMN-dependent dehydrogenase